MKREPRIVLLTSGGWRHRAAAHRLARSLNVIGIISEGPTPRVKNESELSEDDLRAIGEHFRERDAAERRLLGNVTEFPDTMLREVPYREANSSESFEWGAVSRSGRSASLRILNRQTASPRLLSR